MGPRRGRARKLLITVLALFGLSTLCCVGMSLGGFGSYLSWVEGRPGYAEALDLARADAELQDRLGSPLMPGDGFDFEPALPGVFSSEWTFEVELEGPKGAGMLQGTAVADDGSLMSLRFVDPVFEDELDLLNQAKEAEEEAEDAEVAQQVADGLAAVRKGDAKQAMVLLDAVIARDKGNARALLARGELLLEAGELSKAQADLELATLSEATVGDAWRGLGKLHAEARDHQACVDAYTEALRYYASDGEAWWGRAKCYRGLDDLRSFQAGAREACQLSVAEACYSAQR